MGCDGQRTRTNELERTNYRNAILERHPFFVFDASPLLVVYTKTPSGRNEVMYFTAGLNNRLLWTNAAKVTIADAVFKRGPLIEAARLERPFSTLFRAK